MRSILAVPVLGILLGIAPSLSTAGSLSTLIVPNTPFIGLEDEAGRGGAVKAERGLEARDGSKADGRSAGARQEESRKETARQERGAGRNSGAARDGAREASAKDRNRSSRAAPGKEKQGASTGEKSSGKSDAQDAGPTDSAAGQDAQACDAAVLRVAEDSRKVFSRSTGCEVDVLISRMDLTERTCEDMERPRIVSMHRFVDGSRSPEKPVRIDLLGDVEQIRWLGQMAWGINVSLEKPGLYQFSLETRPWWNNITHRYEQQIAKSILPVRGMERGWHMPLGLSFEIIPRVRPFGLAGQVLFTGRVLVDGAAGRNLPVTLERVYGTQGPAPLAERIETFSNGEGDFSALISHPGWWCCRAERDGESMKGPDGLSAPMRVSTLFWFYVAENGLSGR